MKRNYYLIVSDNDNLERKVIHSIQLGESARDKTRLQKLQFLANNYTAIYFSVRNVESSEFVRKLMDECACVLTSTPASAILTLLKNCYPHHVKNLSQNYSSFSSTRV